MEKKRLRGRPEARVIKNDDDNADNVHHAGYDDDDDVDDFDGEEKAEGKGGKHKETGSKSDQAG